MEFEFDENQSKLQQSKQFAAKHNRAGTGEIGDGVSVGS